MDVFKAFAQQVGIVDPFGPGFLSVIITFLVALVFGPLIPQLGG